MGLFTITEYDVMSSESVSLINHLALMYNRFKRFNVNPAEFACMKAILLFKSETTGLKDTTQVENLQDQALAMLRNHIESSSPSNTTRFGRLLMLLANLRFSNAQRIEKTFFENHWKCQNGKIVVRYVPILAYFSTNFYS